MSTIRFHYRGRTREGQTVTGEVDAHDIDEALNMLTAQGLLAVQVVALLTLAEPEPDPAAPARPPRRQLPQLSPAELIRIAEHLEMLARSGMPLSPGLRAAAQDASHRRLADVLLALAHELEAGRTLEQVLATQPELLPSHLSRLIEAGLRSGTLAEALAQLLDIDRASHDMWRTVRQSLSYPLFLVCGYLCLVLFLGIFVLPGLSEIFDSTRLPWSTSIVMWFTGGRLLIVFGIAFAAIPLLLLLFWALLTPVGHWRMLARVPFLGPMLHWRSVATWARLLGLFIENEIPAPEALRLAANSTVDASVAFESRKMAQLTSVGRGLTSALTASRHLPASLVPLVRWGEEAGALPEALQTAGDMFETRVRMRANLLRSVVPPIMFVVVGMGVLMLFNALISPMRQLLTGLY